MHRYLRDRGEEGLEATALLATTAPRADGPVYLDVCILPRQEATRSAYGVSVLIPTAEIVALTSILSQLRAYLRVKVHTHPSEAYHSELDDENMLMRFGDGVSIVIPDFAAGDITRISEWSINKFDTERGWERIPSARGMISLVDAPAPGALRHIDRTESSA